MINFFRRLIQRYGFFKREPDIYHRSGSTVGPLVSADEVWAAHGFFTAEKRRNERLAAIASEISALNVKRLKAKEQKKNQTLFVLRMNELMRERLTIEVRGFHDAKQDELKSSLIK